MDTVKRQERRTKVKTFLLVVETLRTYSLVTITRHTAVLAPGTVFCVTAWAYSSHNWEFGLLPPEAPAVPTSGDRSHLFSVCICLCACMF